MYTKILAAGLALALTACGTPKKSADANDGGNAPQGPGSVGGRLSQSDFQAQCTAKSAAAFTTNDYLFCIVPTGASIDDGYANGAKVKIDANFHDLKYIVSHGTRGATILILGNTRLGSEINYRGQGPAMTGILYLQVLQSSQSKADVTTYECFDYNMHAVYCNDGIIP
jgi:hypothetical protein